MMKKILLDTNFFMVPFQLGVNIMSEFERIMNEPFQLMTISPIKKELEHLARSGKGDDKLSAKLGSELARNIAVIDYSGQGDEAIVSFATTTKDIMVATNDSALRKRLKKEAIPTIFVRNKSKLEIE
jgi:hypothetical protein